MKKIMLLVVAITIITFSQSNVILADGPGCPLNNDVCFEQK
ncbi:hypothetical protein VQL36_08920 [Chengkuizengella sp. SCS-71B]